MSCNGNHLDIMLRINTNINSRDSRQYSWLPTHTHARKSNAYALFTDIMLYNRKASMIGQKCKAENMNLFYK